MKKLIIVLFLTLPLYLTAQDFATLKKRADKFYSKGKYQKAGPLYEKAVELVVTCQEVVKNGDWQKISIVAAETDRKLNNQQNPQYAHIKYGADGEILKKKISDLKEQGIKCVFTYRTFGGMVVSSYLMIDPISKAAVNIGSSWDRKYLVWAGKEGVFMQPFDNFNFYKPVKIENKEINEICINRYDELIRDEIKPLKSKNSEQTAYEFNFYQQAEPYITKKFEEDDLVDPVKYHALAEINRNTRSKNDPDIYKANIQTSFGQLFWLLIAEEKINFPHNSK